MKQTTRDNIIYLTIGLTIAGLLAADFFYADSHGRQMWLPSKFSVRAVAYLGVLDYFVVTETRKVRATIRQIITCVLIASILHLVIVFLFRNIVGAPFGPTLWILAVLEAFIIVQLMVWAITYFGRNGHHSA